MAKIEEFDYHEVRKIQDEINDVLKQIGEAHGINLQLQRVKFDRLGFKGYIEAQTTHETDHGGGNIDYRKKWRDEFLRSCGAYGLEAKHLDSTVLIRGVSYKLIGLQPRAKKYKFICENAKGKCYRFALASIKQSLSLV